MSTITENKRAVDVTARLWSIVDYALEIAFSGVFHAVNVLLGDMQKRTGWHLDAVGSDRNSLHKVRL